MHLNPIHLPVPSYLPSALKTCPFLPQINFKRNGKKNLIAEAVVWNIESHSIPVSPYIFTYKCSLQVRGHEESESLKVRS